MSASQTTHPRTSNLALDDKKQTNKKKTPPAYSHKSTQWAFLIVVIMCFLSEFTGYISLLFITSFWCSTHSYRASNEPRSLPGAGCMQWTRHFLLRVLAFFQLILIVINLEWGNSFPFLPHVHCFLLSRCSNSAILFDFVSSWRLPDSS